ncbi:MAG TPA: hypothetical protein PKY56_14210, partial [Candidatus Kapabacteria bacterium]|nr:hypothetical protein [Candidatus Kapabacteria bacterium]
MFKYILIFIISALPLFGQINSNIIGYEYWLNNDYENITVVELENPSDNVNISFSVDVNELTTGLHLLNLRFIDDSSRYSLTQTKFFVKLPGGAANQDSIIKIVGYEYWLNNDFEEKIIVDTEPSEAFNLNLDFDAANLTTGLHIFNLRFIDEAGNYSLTQTKFFVKLPGGIGDTTVRSKIVSYRYWFNNNFNDAISIELTQPLDTLNLLRDIAVPPLGGQTVRITVQFLDENNNWSLHYSNTFANPNVVYNLEPANLLAPSNNSIISEANINFVWNPVYAADLYVFEVSDISDFSNVILSNESISDTSYSILRTDLPEIGMYYWRIKAKATAPLESDWSEVWSFTTIDEENPLTAPVLVTPLNNAVNLQLPVQFVWNIVQNATTYTLQIATDADFENIIVDDTEIT